MKKLFTNQSGFSMVQGMILAGVLAGSGLVTTKMLTEQKMVQKGIETRDQVEELHNIVYSVLQNNESCSKTMLANGVTGMFNTGTTMQTIPLTEIRNNNDEIVIRKYDNSQSADENLQNRTYMNGNIQVTKIEAHYNPSSGTGMGDLEITYERLSKAAAGSADDGKKAGKAGYGGKQIRKVMGLRVQRNPVLASRPFTSCYSVTASKGSDLGSTEAGNEDIAKKLCQDMIASVPAGTIPAFRWDDATSSCLPNSTCPDHQIYTGIATTGEVKCRNLNEWVDFNTMIQPTSGSCSPGQRARIEITQTSPSVRFRIQCY